MKTKQLLRSCILIGLLWTGYVAANTQLANSNQDSQVIKVISATNAPQAIGPFVQAKQYNNLVYTSGNIGLTKEGVLAGNDIQTQTHQLMENLQAVLAAAGTDFNHVIKTTCFLTDMKNFEEFNKAYATFFKASFPARTCIGITALPKNALVEVEVIAVVPVTASNSST